MQNQAFAALALCAVLLLSGCLGSVPQSKYDELKAECAKQNETASSSLSAANLRADNFKLQAEDCLASKQATEKLLSDQNAQMASLKRDSATLASARQKTELIAKYRSALEQFNDAYGPGKVPTTPKVNNLNALVVSIKDPALYGSWLDFTRCTVPSECSAAKERFAANVNSSVSSLAYQTVDIIKAG